MATPKVGGEIDAFCTKCRMTLAHTILAMVGSKAVRVQCNTCSGQHSYRTEGRNRERGTARAPTPRKEVISFEQRLSERGTGAAQPYTPRETFAVDALINHPTFGLGFVLTVRDEKIDVAFKGMQKTLVHGRTPPAAVTERDLPPSSS